jgi:hypothetical protein
MMKHDQVLIFYIGKRGGEKAEDHSTFEFVDFTYLTVQASGVNQLIIHRRGRRKRRVDNIHRGLVARGIQTTE